MFPNFPKARTHIQYTENIHTSYLIVCANIYHHRQTFLRSNAATGSVQAKFSDRDAHSINPQIP